MQLVRLNGRCRAGKGISQQPRRSRPARPRQRALRPGSYVIEDAPTAGIRLGWGHYLRDVAVTGNVVRRAGIGIAVSVAAGAGSALIADNLIATTRHGAVVGMEWGKAVTGDLAAENAIRYAQLSISGNRVR